MQERNKQCPSTTLMRRGRRMHVGVWAGDKWRVCSHKDRSLCGEEWKWCRGECAAGTVQYSRVWCGVSSQEHGKTSWHQDRVGSRDGERRAGRQESMKAMRPHHGKMGPTQRSAADVCRPCDARQVFTR